MTKRDGKQDPNDPERRRIVQGGLLAAAAALGFLPGCGEGEGQAAAAESGGPAAGSGTPPGGTGAPGPQAARAGASGSSVASSSGAVAGRPGAAAAPSGGGGAAAPSGGAPSGGTVASGPAGAGGAPQAGMPGSAGGPAAGAAQPMAAGMQIPRAMLGKTGVMVPIVALGTSRLGQRGGTPNQADFDNMVKVFTQALDLGIEYVDTGANYGRAEEALGIVLKGRRDKVFLTTKLYTNSYNEAKSLFERSLQRLQTDHVDLLHLHSVGERNIDTVLSQNGSWRFIQEQKQMGRTRFVGITGHSSPPNFMRML